MFSGRFVSRMFRRSSKTRNRVRSTSRWDKTRLNFLPLEERAVPTVYTVTAPGDLGNAGDLRSTVALANSDPGSTVKFDQTVFSAASTITLTAPIDITADMTISGLEVGGSSSMSISGGNANQIFKIPASLAINVNFDNLTITGGKQSTGGGSVGGGSAVALLSTTASVTFTKDVLSNNVATISGTGAVISAPSAFSGLVTFNQSLVTGNVGTQGAVYTWTSGNITVSSSTFSLNSSGGQGGAIHNFSGSTSITNSLFSNNTAAGSTGGGAVRHSSGSLTISGSTFTSNTTTGSGGAVNMSGGTITLDSSNFTNNTAASAGGALRNSGSATVTNSIFTGNTAAGSGGGGGVYSSGALNASTVVFTNNRATNASGVAGALRTTSGATIAFADFNANTAATAGGAIHASSGTVTVNNSTFRNNTAGTVGGAISASTTFNINQTTFNKNTAAGTAGGGAIAQTSTSALTINNSTVAGNTASSTSTTVGGGGILRSAAGALTLNSTIVAGNKTGGGTNNVEFFNSVTTSFTLVGNNSLFGTTSGSMGAGTTLSGSYIVGDPNLSALADNDGVLLPDGNKIKTMAVPGNSLAIDAGNNTPGFVEDQRGPGFTRLSGGVVDVGAFEGVSHRPYGTLVNAPDVGSKGSAAYSFDVVWHDADTGIDSTTLDVNDVTVTGSGYGAGQHPTSFVVNGSGPDYTVTYTIPAPTGGWGGPNGANVGVYSIAMTKGQVADQDTPTANTNSQATLGSFKAAFATSLVVSQASDVVDTNVGAGQLSFREALIIANQNAGFTDTISFDSTVFNTAMTITLTGGAGAVTDSLVINGPTASFTFDANKTNQQLTVSSGVSLTVSNLSFSRFSAGSAGGVLSLGSNDSVSLSNVSFSNNTASVTGGGAIGITGTATSVTLTNASFTSNTSSSSGGAIYASGSNNTITVDSSSFTNNTASTGGGAIRGSTSTTLAVTNSSFTGNTSSGTGGGAMYLGSSANVTVSGSTLQNNTASSPGGGIYIASGSLGLTNDVFNNNKSGSTAGALYTSSGTLINIDATKFSNNTGTTVGGIYVGSTSSTLTIDRSMFSGNTGGTAGAIHFASGGTHSITNSTFSANTGSAGAGAINSSSSPTLNISQSTFAQNRGTTAGAINLSSTSSTGTLTIQNSTIANNTASAGAGGINSASTASLNQIILSSTIVGANSGTTSADINTAVGATISGDHNLIGAQGANWTISGAPNKVGATSAQIGVVPLADNNGFKLLDNSVVQTMNLTANSQARDNGFSNGLTFDERGPGHSRTIGADTDIGAFEANANPVPTVSGDATNVTGPGGTTFDVTVTFKDDLGVDVSTIDVNDVVVKTARGQTTLHAASFVASPNSGVSSPVTVVYTFNAPDNGVAGQWDATDTDLYNVWFVGTVSDDDNPDNNVVAPQQLATFAAPLAPQTLTVDQTGDVDDGNYGIGHLTLREAINFANQNVNNIDTITFDATAFASPTTITLGSTLAITDAVVIQGAGASKLTLDGNNAVQIFSVNLPSGGLVDMSGMTLQKGNSGLGGAIGMTDDALTLTNMVLNANTTSGTGGAIAMTTGTLSLVNTKLTSNTAATSGGAIYSSGASTITLQDSTLNANTGTTGGGIYIGSGSMLTIDPSILSNNRGTNGSAIYVAGTTTSSVVIDKSLISGNTSTSSHGAIYFFTGGTLAVTDSTFANNSAASTGGAIAFWSGSSASVSNSTFNGNKATSGAAIAILSSAPSLTLQNVTIAGNTASAGVGGILLSSSSTALTLDTSIVAGNVGTTTADILTQTGAVISGDYNVIGVKDASWSLGNPGTSLVGTSAAPQDPGLNPLGDNGGFTLPDGSKIPTMSLKANSVAADLGTSFSTLSNDERGAGFPRVVNNAVDAGAFEAPISPIPKAKLLSAPDITSAGTSPETITIVYTDDVGINTNSLDNNDVTVTGSGLNGAKATFTGFSGSGTSVTATYTVAAPAGGWGGWNIGSFVVAVNGNQVFDTDTPTPNSTPAGNLGTFKTAFATTLAVDLASDVSDGNYTPGNRTLREAILLANGNAGLDTITFSFPSATTINLTSGFTVADSLEIDGPGANKLTVNANKTGTHFTTADNQTLAISGITLTGGSTAGSGGAISIGATSTVTLNDVVLRGNTAGTYGGAIFLSAKTSEVDITDSTLADNFATGTGGAISGLHSTGSPVINITSSTLSGNKTNSDGGAVYLYDDGTVTVSNSTFSGNSAAGVGGALYFYNSGASTYVVRNSTIANNTSGGTGGGIYTAGTTFTLELDSSIVSGNHASTTATSDMSTSWTVTGDNNLVGISAGTFTGTGNQLGSTTAPIDPLLSPLGNYGGKTQTMALKSGSPALDMGNNNFSLSFDQRGTGHPRVLGAAADVGAFEGINTAPIATLGSAPSITSSGATTYSFSVIYTDNVGIDSTTIDVNDVKVTGPGFGAGVSPASYSIAGPANNMTVTYTIPVAGGWSQNNNGQFTVTLNPNQVYDTDGPSPVGAGDPVLLGNFNVGIGGTFVVDATNDESVDTDGKTSLREALAKANAATGSSNTINFDSTVFGTAQTITLTLGELPISSSVIINNTNVTTASSLAITASTGARVFNVASGKSAAVVINGVKITGASVSGAGGGILLGTTDSLTLNGVWLANNTASGIGGGIGVDTAQSPSTQKITVNNSTISGNSASTGGAIYFLRGSQILVSNSTLSGNSASTGGAIGGFTTSSGSITVRNSTVTGNSSSNGRAFRLTNAAYSVGVLSLESTIVSGNVGTSPNSIYGSSTAGWFNQKNSVIESPTGSANDLGGNLADGTDPMLGSLSNNGGATPTHALLAGSPALNTGSNPDALTTDQRGTGFARTSGSGTDMGAFEAQVATAPAPTVSSVVLDEGTGGTINGVNGTTQRSEVRRIVVTFSEAVNFSGSVASAFTLARSAASTSGGTTGQVSLVASPATGPASSVTITFTGTFADSTGSLVDGLYNFSIDASKVSGAGGQLNGSGSGAGTNYSVTGTTANKWFRYYGDQNGDGTVDQTDYLVFRNALANGPNSVFDYQNSGDVDQSDYLEFRNRLAGAP
ncbi:MAG: beta strand repeat-containing protein [Gemmataceae bacterium]